MKGKLSATLLVYTLLFSCILSAQDVKIKLGESEVNEDGTFNIAVTVSNGNMKITSPFPDIPGFQKGAPSYSQSQSIRFNGSQSVTYITASTIQPYFPTKLGKVKLKPFSMTVSGKRVKSPGKEITVKKSNSKKKDKFNIIFGGDLTKKLELKNMDSSNDGAFLALTVSKDEIYVGEGVLVRLAFYIPTTDKNKFHVRDDVERISQQLEKIESQLKPSQCWEEDFNISRLIEEREVINNKLYSRYKLYEAMYFPLNNEDIVFPSVSLNMLKYNPSHARGQYFYGPEGYKTFYSSEKKINVKDLPPHPLKDYVNVGEYKLAENLTVQEINTGESFQYSFQVKGVGNIASIKKPSIPAQDEFIIYPGNVHQEVNRVRGNVYGARQFVYDIEPVEPGKYDIGDYFKWVYFNPVTEKYDTLRSEHQLTVVGQSKKNLEIASNNLGTFYDDLFISNNTLQGTSDTRWLTVFANFTVILLLSSIVWLVRK
ncbi:MAG: BatD family protein [Flammeovirgaceae bacterium]